MPILHFTVKSIIGRLSFMAIYVMFIEASMSIDKVRVHDSYSSLHITHDSNLISEIKVDVIDY